MIRRSLTEISDFVDNCAMSQCNLQVHGQSSSSASCSCNRLKNPPVNRSRCEHSFETFPFDGRSAIPSISASTDLALSTAAPTPLIGVDGVISNSRDFTYFHVSSPILSSSYHGFTELHPESTSSMGGTGYLHGSNLFVQAEVDGVVWHGIADSRGDVSHLPCGRAVRVLL